MVRVPEGRLHPPNLGFARGTPPLRETEEAMSERPKDQTPLVSDLSDDADIVELVEMFVTELPKRLAAMQEMLASNDLARLTTLAHQLKGSAGSYGFPSIGCVAAEIEKASRQCVDVDQIKSEIEELAELCRRARATPDDTPRG